MTAPVSSLTVLRERREQVKAIHPSGRTLPSVVLPKVDRAAALTQLARCWEELHTTFTSGPGALDDDSGHEVLQWFASALVHPAAVGSLVFEVPPLIAAVRQYDAVRDGDTHPADLECRTYTEAVAEAEAEVDAHLYPLLHGLSLRDACRWCRHTRPVASWEPQVGCSVHGSARMGGAGQ